MTTNVMSFPALLTLYVVTGIVFCMLDFLWLGFVVKDLYARELGDLLLASPVKLPAIIFYLLYVAGIITFAVLPGLQANSLAKALVLGAFLGLVAYATYDLSNLATLKGWSTKLAVIDIGWGMFATGTASLIGMLVSRSVLARFGG